MKFNSIIIVFFIMFIVICCSETGGSSGGGSSGGGGGSSNDGNGNGNGNGNGTNNNTNITGLNSFVLQSTNHNRLEWDLINNSTYNIYRYQLQSDANPDLVIQNHNTNVFEDNSCLADTPYYYKIASVINGVEGNMSNFAFGLRSSVIDSFEDNSNLNDFQNSDPGLPLNTLIDAMLYSCRKDNSGDIDTDADWYKYRGNAQYFEVLVILGNTNFDNDDIKLQFRYESTNNNIIERDFSILDNNTTTCGFGNVGDYDGDAGINPVNVYFRIYVDGNNVDTSINIIEKYKLEISI